MRRLSFAAKRGSHWNRGKEKVVQVEKISQPLSNKLANMGFVCACLVVLIHVPDVEIGMFVNDFVFQWFKRGVAMIAVPVFFVMSGFFLGRHINEEGWYAKAIKSRIRTLVVPFFTLSLLWLPVFFFFHYIGVRYFGADDSNRSMDLTIYNVLHGLGVFPWGGNVVVGLWYVRALFYLVLLSPCLAWVVKKGRGASLALLGLFAALHCVQARFPITADWIDTLTFSFRCPFFFFVGMALSQYAPKTLPKHSALWLVPLGVGSLCLLKFISVPDPAMKTFVALTATVLIALAVWSLMPASEWPHSLVGNSFPIFVLHGSILYLLPIPFKALHVWDGTIHRFGFLPVWILTILLALGVAQIVKGKLPRLANIIFGGR